MSGRPTSSVSSSRKPVTTGRWKLGDSRPVNGSSSQRDAEQQDEEQPPEEFRQRQQHDRAEIGDRLLAACRARGTGTARPRCRACRRSASPAAASSMVAGKVEPTRPATPRRKWIEVPKSPCSTWPSQIRYCRGSGWSRPISWRLASISASVAFGGSDIAAGSTGSSRRMQNSSAETMSRIDDRDEDAARDQREDGGHGLPDLPLMPANAANPGRAMDSAASPRWIPA